MWPRLYSCHLVLPLSPAAEVAAWAPSLWSGKVWHWKRWRREFLSCPCQRERLLEDVPSVHVSTFATDVALLACESCTHLRERPGGRRRRFSCLSRGGLLRGA